jgi:hypothetical protein
MVTIDRLVDIVAGIASKSVRKHHVDGPTGVRGRKSDNHLIREKLGWAPSTLLADGLRPTYDWIHGQVMRNVRSNGPALPISAVMAGAESERAAMLPRA